MKAPEKVEIPRHPDHSLGGTFHYAKDGTFLRHELPTARTDAELAAREKAAQKPADAADETKSPRASKRGGSQE